MPANSVAKLAVIITGDASGVRSAVNEAGVAMGGLTPKTLASSAALTALAAAAAAFVKTGIAARANIEQLKISFEVMTGSAKMAQSLINDLQKLSLNTPLNMSDVQQAGKTLMAMGEPVEAIVGDLKMLGDIAAGTGQPLNELSQVFGQVMQAGRLTGNELRQFNERGVPLLTALSDQMGVSKAAIRKMVEEGQVGSNDVVKAFESMTGAGGKFANMMERQTETIIGQWNKLKENLTLVAADSVSPLEGDLRGILKYLNDEYIPAFRRLYMGGEDSPTAAYETQNKATADSLRQLADAQKLAEDAVRHFNDMLDDMDERGESLSKSLRTPFEVMRDALAETVALFNSASIDSETYSRSVNKIASDFEKASKSAKNIQSSIYTGAVERGTMAEYSARLESKSQSDKLVEETKNSIAVEKQILEAAKDINISIQKKPSGGYRVGRLI